MTRWVNVSVQILGTAAQILFASGALGKWNWIPAAVIGAIQAGAATAAHSYNPDGTPATEPYRPKV